MKEPKQDNKLKERDGINLETLAEFALFFNNYYIEKSNLKIDIIRNYFSHWIYGLNECNKQKLENSLTDMLNEVKYTFDEYVLKYFAKQQEMVEHSIRIFNNNEETKQKIKEQEERLKNIASSISLDGNDISKNLYLILWYGCVFRQNITKGEIGSFLKRPSIKKICQIFFKEKLQTTKDWEKENNKFLTFCAPKEQNLSIEVPKNNLKLEHAFTMLETLIKFEKESENYLENNENSIKVLLNIWKNQKPLHLRLLAKYVKEQAKQKGIDLKLARQIGSKFKKNKSRNNKEGKKFYEPWLVYDETEYNKAQGSAQEGCYTKVDSTALFDKLPIYVQNGHILAKSQNNNFLMNLDVLQELANNFITNNNPVDVLNTKIEFINNSSFENPKLNFKLPSFLENKEKIKQKNAEIYYQEQIENLFLNEEILPAQIIIQKCDDDILKILEVENKTEIENKKASINLEIGKKQKEKQDLSVNWKKTKDKAKKGEIEKKQNELTEEINKCKAKLNLVNSAESLKEKSISRLIHQKSLYLARTIKFLLKYSNIDKIIEELKHPYADCPIKHKNHILKQYTPTGTEWQETLSAINKHLKSEMNDEIKLPENIKKLLKKDYKKYTYYQQWINALEREKNNILNLSLDKKAILFGEVPKQRKTDAKARELYINNRIVLPCLKSFKLHLCIKKDILAKKLKVFGITDGNFKDKSDDYANKKSITISHMFCSQLLLYKVFINVYKNVLNDEIKINFPEDLPEKFDNLKVIVELEKLKIKIPASMIYKNNFAKNLTTKPENLYKLSKLYECKKEKEGNFLWYSENNKEITLSNIKGKYNGARLKAIEELLTWEAEIFEQNDRECKVSWCNDKVPNFDKMIKENRFDTKITGLRNDILHDDVVDEEYFDKDKKKIKIEFSKKNDEKIEK